MVTLKDVAKRAGVSAAAVSYVLNGKEGVNDENRKRILATIEEMGYKPNQLARSLLTNKSNVIGILISDISVIYNMEFVANLERFVSAKNMQFMLGCTGNDRDREKKHLENFISHNVDGLVICPSSGSDHESLGELLCEVKKREIPCVLFYYPSPDSYCESIVPDLKRGEYELTKHLISSGYLNPVFFSGPLDNYYSKVRFEGFREALAEKNISAEKRFFVVGEAQSYLDGRRGISEYLKTNELPDVFVAVNDVLAYGMIRELKKLGFRVPEDVGVAGFDNLSLPTMEDVNMTTVSIPLGEMARRCVELLTDEKHVFEGRTYVLETTVQQGDTTLAKKDI